jgi:hypothetical protein
MSIGRPTIFKEEYCQMLIEHMRQGYSFESFGAYPVCVTKDTLYSWLKQHPQFAYAKKLGTIECRKLWEKLGLAGASGKLPGFNTAAWIFNMKNRFMWRDRVEQIEDNRLNTVRIELPGAKEQQVISLDPSEVKEEPVIEIPSEKEMALVNHPRKKSKPYKKRAKKVDNEKAKKKTKVTTTKKTKKVSKKKAKT